MTSVSEGPFDVAVAWRIYPGVSKTPLIHADNKLALVETCLRSFIASACDLRVRYRFILDGCPEAYPAMIHSLFSGERYSIIETPRIGNGSTFAKQVELLRDQTESEVVYFAEDDYLYKPGEFAKMHQFLKENTDVDFVSCYCHNDIFTHPLHQHPRTVKYSAGRLWLGASSTCLTFMTTRRTLRETQSHLLTYCSGNWDCGVWLGLTRTHVLNPFAFLRYKEDSESWKILRMAVKHGWRQLLRGKGYSLYVPYPGIGTHLEASLVSPETDWLQVAAAVDSRVALPTGAAES